MAERADQRMRLWEDEPETVPAVEAPRERPAPVLLTMAADGSLVVTGAENVGPMLEIPAEINGHRVVAIGPSAFRGNVALQRVILPEGLRTIGRSAFQGCVNLVEVTLPGSMEDIGECAFQGCSALTRLALPAGLTEIADRAFYGCGSLEAVAIPVGVLRVGERAFAGCRSLREVELPEGLKCIEPWAFADCTALKMPRIPASVVRLSANALPRADMRDGQHFLPAQRMLVRAEVKRDYAVPPGTRSLAGWALAGNESVLTVDFGDALEVIGPYALSECVCLKRVALPRTVREVGRGAFSGCQRMTSAVLSPGMKGIPAELFRGCRALEEVEGFPGIEAIGDRAFEDCAALKSLALPEGVRTVGERAFYRCRAMERLELPASLSSLGPGALSGCEGLRVLVVKGRCDGAMLPVLSDARRAAIVAPSAPPEAFPGLWRKRVCLGYALAQREGLEFAPEAARGCMEWMRAHGGAFLDEALRDTALMHLLVDGECLSEETVQAMLERVEGPDSDDYNVTLLNYKHRRFGGSVDRSLSLW